MWGDKADDYSVSRGLLSDHCCQINPRSIDKVFLGHHGLLAECKLGNSCRSHSRGKELYIPLLCNTFAHLVLF